MRGNGIYLANSPANHYQTPRPTTMDIPAGATTFSTRLHSDGFDAVSRQGMQRVRVILQDWSYGFDPVSGNYRMGWWEVRTTDSAEDVVVGDKNVATAVETGVGIVGDFFWGAFAGSDGLDAGLAGDMTLSLIPVIGVYTDIRDLAKGLWQSAGLSNQPADGMEMSIAALGIVAEFFPPADYFTDGAKFAWKIVKHFRNTRSAAQAAQIMLALEPFIEGAVTELWNKAFGPTDAYAGYPPSPPPLYGSGTLPPGSPEGEATEAFWNAFVKILEDFGGKNTKRAARMIDALRKNDPDFMEGLAELSLAYGKNSHRFLNILIDSCEVDKINYFDAVIGAALRASKSASGGGKPEFLSGLTLLTQSIAAKSTQGLASGASQVKKALENAIKSNEINKIGQFISQIGKMSNSTGAIGSRVPNGYVAKFVRKMFAVGQTTTIRYAEDVLDEINDAFSHLTISNPHAAANAKEIRTWVQTTANAGGDSASTANPMLGYIQEMQDVARRHGEEAEIQIVARNGSLHIDHRYKEIDPSDPNQQRRLRVNGESKLVGQGANASNQVKMDIARHLDKYVEEMNDGLADLTRLTTKDAAGATAIRDYVLDTKNNFLALTQAFDRNKLYFEGLPPRRPRQS